MPAKFQPQTPQKNGRYHTTKGARPADTPPAHAAGQRRNWRRNIYTAMADEALLGACPRKFKAFMQAVLSDRRRHGYIHHRRLLCSYLQALDHLRWLEGQMERAYGCGMERYARQPGMGRVQLMKRQDLYHLCGLNGIEVPFGSTRTEMLAWLEEKARAHSLILPAKPGKENKRGVHSQ